VTFTVQVETALPHGIIGRRDRPSLRR